MKANGGVFVVDDFGRQRIPARDLLNRWIVPLESRVDYLTLHTGRKFEIPFNVLVVFATNLKPQSLADEAFLRRIPYKIPAKNPTMDEYCRIFEMNCQRRGVQVRSGDGRVPGSQVLPAAKPADARVPPARPDLAGRRPLPVRRQGPGDHARAARRGVRELLRRGRQNPRVTNNEVHGRRRSRRGQGQRRARHRPRHASGRRAPAAGARRGPRRGAWPGLRRRRRPRHHRRALLVHGGADRRELPRDGSRSPASCCWRAKRWSWCSRCSAARRSSSIAACARGS